MTEPIAAILVVLDAHAQGIEKYASTLKHPILAKTKAEVAAALLEFREAQAAAAELIEALQHARRVMAAGLDPQKAIDAADEALRKAGVA